MRTRAVCSCSSDEDAVRAPIPNRLSATVTDSSRLLERFAGAFTGVTATYRTVNQRILQARPRSRERTVMPSPPHSDRHSSVLAKKEGGQLAGVETDAPPSSISDFIAGG